MTIMRNITALPTLQQLLLAEQSHQPLPIYHEHGMLKIVFDGDPHEQLGDSLYRFHGRRADTSVRVALEIWIGKEAALEFFDDAQEEEEDAPSSMPAAIRGH